jgi:hypothetical protein
MAQRLTIDQVVEEAKKIGVQMSDEDINYATTIPIPTVLSLLKYRALEIRSNEEALQRSKQNSNETLK